MPLAAVAGIGAAGSLISGIIGSNAAGNAASAQANAANNAAQLQYQTGQNALGFQQQQWNTAQQEAQPWLQSGTGAISNLDYLMGITPQGTAQSAASPYGSLTQIPGQQPVQEGTFPTAQGTAQRSQPLNVSAMGRPPSNGTASQVPGSGLVAGNQTSFPTFQAQPDAAGNAGGFGSLMQPYQGSFQAPTVLTMQNDPGYQARLQLGTQALQQSAAARGDVVTGGTANDLNQYAQNFASNEYGNVYNRALNNYMTNYDQYNQQQAKQYNQLAALSGVGQQTAQQLGQMGANVANTASNTAMNTANNMGQDYQNAGAANASGYIGGANAINGAIGSGTSNLSQLMMLQQMQGGGNAGLGTGNQGQAYVNTTPSAYNGLL